MSETRPSIFIKFDPICDFAVQGPDTRTQEFLRERWDFVEFIPAESADYRARQAANDAVISEIKISRLDARVKELEAALSDMLLANDDGPGLIDCIDNIGDRYTSPFLDDTIRRRTGPVGGGAVSAPCLRLPLPNRERRSHD